ncbi:TRAP C4-dicarboxylate transport system permease DctM subunit [Moorella glycerini]|uniref:Sialic acid TRAP transporter permease protein SiaT n=1 Tax=Neomoorella stamsii TaxID=1266720 RepID=A0A9X7P4N2_9FIRM|nr:MULTISPECIES: TRAP transporter large permease subunit [Moorella]PRR68564.1 Sialic acid TRAP transporter permease protein SiaT [Moorella stamsii]CEP66112.1 TRAP C4-dicarboxylate transport system permease DctM subunit [Moorella glycerini]
MNGLNKAIAALDKVGILSRWVNMFGVAVLFLMVILTFVNVILRKFFNSPIIGVVEITEVMMLVAIFLGIAYTQDMEGHVRVDVITARLAPRPKLTMESINDLLAIAMFVIVIWQVIERMLVFIQRNTMHSPFLPIPAAPIAAIVIFGCILLTLLLIRDFLLKLTEALQLGLKLYHWGLMFGVPILLAGSAIFWMQPNLWNISLPFVGLIGIVVSLILFFMGMPIAFALLLVSFVFVAHIKGTLIALDMVGTEMYRTACSYSWSTLPFFVLMGFICLYAKFGDDLFRAAYKWIGHLRGGMATATIGACAAFAAIVGDSVAATATMTAVAMPEMKKVNYDDHLTAGCIVSGAALGPIIPPSVTFIIFGLLTGVSIGELFVAGIIPGIIMALCFIAVIFAWCRINPGVAPAGERSGWKSRIVSLKAVGPVLILFLLVIGGIYTGLFTPTEGGAIGAVVALILGIITKRFTLGSFAQSLLEAGKVTSMVFLILISAQMFARFAAWCNVSPTLTTLITNLRLSPAGFVVFVLVILSLAGCFIDGLALILISIPILYPIAVSLGIDPIWFLVLIAISVNMGNFTPPVGINLFVLKGMNKDIPVSVIYKGALPFVLANIVALALLFFIPGLITWLPAALK